MRGQIKIEFMLAIVAFSIVVFAIATQVNSTANIVSSDSMNDVLRIKAIGLIGLLVEDPAWLSSGEPYSIDMFKLVGLNTSRNASTNQCTRLEPLDLGGYRLTIANSTHTLLRCGALVVGTSAVSITRIVWIEQDYGTITVEMW